MSKVSNDMKSSCMFHIYFLLLLIINSEASHIIKSLPGYSGDLPFNLETGYIGVGKNEQVQLFYYFIESERDPSSDPLVFWLTGGPGCSGFSAIVYEIGPMTFSDSIPNARFPSLVPNPYSWTKVANIIFIDSPVGTGYSYATTQEGYSSSDTKSTEDNYTFLRKWLLNHPKFINNRLYIAGDSYSGITVPMLALEIAKGNEDGLYPQMTLQGYLIGNGRSNARNDNNEKVPYAHRMALISDEYFELAKSSCHGEYVNPDPSNHKCLHALRLIEQCTHLVNKAHILEDECKPERPRKSRLSYMFLEDIPVDSLFLVKEEGKKCRFEIYETSYDWANDKLIQEALHIRKDTVTEWIRCNRSLTHHSYEIDVESVYEYHQILSIKGYRVLAYSGDHDMNVPFPSTLKWIRHLNLSIDEAWRPWIVDDQVAGYTETYKNIHADITFATVKGAGHTAPEYKPKECVAMFSRWLSLNPL